MAALRVLLYCVAWTVALVPFVLIAAAETGDPTETARISYAVGDGLRDAAWISSLLGIGALLVFPPALPSVRLAFRAIRRRLGVDQARLLGALERLRHNETSNDHREVARARMALGDTRRALQHALRAAELEPSSLPARLLYAQLALRNGHVEEAHAQLEAIVGKDENLGFGDALLALSEARRRTGDRDGAVRALERHAALNGERRDVALRLARLLDRIDRRAAATTALRTAARPPADSERLDLDQRYARAVARMALLWRPTPAGDDSSSDSAS